MKNLILLTFLTATISFAGDKVIYGDDNRVDVYASTNSAFVELAKSTAAMVKNTDVIQSTDGMMKIDGKKLEDEGICKSERFSHQVSGANCSGFLVGDDLLVTAGHCIRSQSSCEKWSWVFDYAVENDTQSEVSVPKSSVYKCKKLVEQKLTGSDKDDYALIQLDRVVTERNPLSFRKSGKIEKGANLVVIGHPSGLPTKIADGSKVRDLEGTYFTANLDTYGGNSGSAVFNVDTGDVEGILVRGETDYTYDYENNCRVSNVVADNAGRGEDVTYITNIKALKSK